MSNPFVGEIRMFGGNFAPAGWAFCAGQPLPISENDTLFNLIGTTYGGDGQENFNLPDLQGRFPMHAGQGPGISQNYQIGEMAGVESVTLSTNQIPAHSHLLQGSNSPASTQLPGGNVAAQGVGSQIYTSASSPIAISPQSITPTGGSQPHENLQPYLTLSFIISLFGIYPHQ